MLRLTPFFLAIPLALSLGVSVPAKAECARYKVWDSDRDSYVWQYDCDRSNRNHNDPYFYPRHSYRNRVYRLLRQHRDGRYYNHRWNSRYNRDWRHDRNRRDWDYDRNWRYEKNGRNWDYDRDWRYDKNPELRIFLGF
jgi:hypothetical protein